MYEMDRLKSPLGAFGSSGLIFRHVVVFLLLTRFDGGQSQDSGQPQLIVATVGDNVTLPCFMNAGSDPAEQMLEWSRPGLNPKFVHVRRSGKDHLVDQNPSYKGRTLVSKDNLSNGDMSLKISRVKLSDEGIYKCFIPGMKIESKVQLSVDADIVVSTVSGRELQCESKGWDAEPEVLWLDGEGNLLSAGPTETVRGPDDLYTVSSRVTVEKRHSNTFTCRVQQGSGLSRDGGIHVPDDSSPKSSAPVIIGLFVGIMAVLAAAFFVIRWRQEKHKSSGRTEDEETPTNYVSANTSEQKPLIEEEREQEQQKTEKNNQREQPGDTGSGSVMETQNQEEDTENRTEANSESDNDSFTSTKTDLHQDQPEKETEGNSMSTQPTETDPDMGHGHQGSTEGNAETDHKETEDNAKTSQTSIIKSQDAETPETNIDQKTEGSEGESPESRDKKDDGTEDTTSPASNDEGGRADQLMSVCPTEGRLDGPEAKDSTSGKDSNKMEENLRPPCPETPEANIDQKTKGSEDESPESRDKKDDGTEDTTSPASNDEGGRADQLTSVCVNKEPGPTERRLDGPEAKDPKSEKDSNKMEENTILPCPQTPETNKNQKTEESEDESPESRDKEDDGTEDTTSPAPNDEGGRADQLTSVRLQTPNDSKPPTPAVQEEQADEVEPERQVTHDKTEKQVQTTTDAGNVDPSVSEVIAFSPTATRSDAQEETVNTESNEERGGNTNVAANEGEKTSELEPGNKTGDEHKTEESREEQSVAAAAAEKSEGQKKGKKKRQKKNLQTKKR